LKWSAAVARPCWRDRLDDPRRTGVPLVVKVLTIIAWFGMIAMLVWWLLPNA
jgi:hypothetical protein